MGNSKFALIRLLFYLMKGEGIKSLLILTLTIGSLCLAILDKEYRPFFADLAKFGLGGYLGQLLPKREN
jgi:hypothetical protein